LDDARHSCGVLPEGSVAFLFIFCLGDPLFFWDSIGEETTSDEDIVLSARRVVHLHAYFLDLIRVTSVSGVCQLGRELLSKTGGQSGKHGSSASHDDILEKFDDIYHLNFIKAGIDHFGDAQA